MMKKMLKRAMAVGLAIAVAGALIPTNLQMVKPEAQAATITGQWVYQKAIIQQGVDTKQCKFTVKYNKGDAQAVITDHDDITSQFTGTSWVDYKKREDGY